MHESVKNLLVAIAILIAAFVYMADAPLLVDERPHLAQIQAFHEGDFTLKPDVTTIPGFHYLLFGISRASGLEGKIGLRCIAFMFSILAVFIYWKLSKKPLPFLFLPLLFPFFFLLYTDVLTLVFILLGFLLVQRKQYNLAALAAIAAILVRQSAIVWLVFLLIQAYAREQLSIAESVKKYWLFLVGILGFGIFVILNRGVSIGDFAAHPAFQIHLGNVYFLLFLCCFLFLPSIVDRRTEVIAQLRRWPLLLAFFLLYIFTFQNTHPYNVDWTHYFIRNWLLVFFTQSIVHKVIFFIPVAIAILYLCATRLREKAFYALYPLTLLYLVPSWLIESRYYIPPITLFLLCRKEDSSRTRWMTTVLWAAVSLVLLHGMRNDLFFP